MTNLNKLETFIRGLGWYSGNISLNVKLEAEFEGFYGKANESWNSRVTIEIIGDKPFVPSGIIEKKEPVCPSIKCVGGQYQDIEAVAETMLILLDKTMLKDQTQQL